MAPLLGDLIKGGGLGGHIFISVGGFKEARGGWVVIFGQRPKIYTFPSGIFLTPPGLSQHLMQACCPNISCCPNIPILLSQHLSLAVPTSQSCCPNISVLLSNISVLLSQHLMQACWKAAALWPGLQRIRCVKSAE